MSPHGHETALWGPIELFLTLIAAAATALLLGQFGVMLREPLVKAKGDVAGLSKRIAARFFDRSIETQSGCTHCIFCFAGASRTKLLAPIFGPVPHLRGPDFILVGQTVISLVAASLWPGFDRLTTDAPDGPRCAPHCEDRGNVHYLF
jgi:hypothetical protein